MIDEINKRQKRQFTITLIVMILSTLVAFILSLIVGQYGLIDPISIIKMILNGLGAHYVISNFDVNVIQYIRLPRTLAAFLVGGSLSVSGLVYQNTFNNKLVSPDILGVSAGACVGAGVAILLGLNGALTGIVSFILGLASVMIALLLPKLFRNKSTLTLVLSGIIVGSFMNAVIGLIKYIADKHDKLSAITFWMMGSLAGVTLQDILYVLPLIVVATVILFMMSNRIDVVSLGREEAQSLGINYKLNRFTIIVCATILTSCSVAISGNVGWIGLVVPHIAGILVGGRAKHTLPIAFLFGSTFMILVDMLSRTISTDNIPLSIITGLLGALIYAIILIKKGKGLYDR